MSNRNPKTATVTKAVSVHRFRPALARLNVHSRHDRAECYAISFYTIGTGSQVWARGSTFRVRGKDKRRGQEMGTKGNLDGWP